MKIFLRSLSFPILILCVLGITHLLKAEDASVNTFVDTLDDTPEDTSARETKGGSDGSTTSVLPSDTALEQKVTPAKVDMSRRITLDLRNMEVVDALKYLGLRSGMNIVTSKTVSGSVTFQLKDVPIQDIFDITLLSNSLAYEKMGEIYYVMTEKEYETRHGKAFGDARKVKMYNLKYAIPQKAFDLLDTLKSSVGRLLVDQESGTVLIMDTPEKIQQMEEALQVLEQQNQVNIFNLAYAEAKDVEEQLRAQLDDKNVGSIRADERSNQVIVQTLPDRMNQIERVIKTLDKKTKEVLIDAKIIQIRLSDALSAGFEWEGLFKELTKNGGTKFIGSHPLSPVFRTGKTFVDDFTKIAPEDANPPAGAKTTFSEQIFFGKTSGDYAHEILIKFLQTLGETKLLSNPKLAVINKQEAKIHIGRKEAYITTTTTTGQTTTTTAEEVNFIDIGIQLAVTPTINDEGYITMKIKPEISSVVDVLVAPSGNKIPIVDTSVAETTVMVQDNTTIIIGGLRSEGETNTNKRVPFFGAIPIIGNLLSNQDRKKDRSELIVMLTPHIIEGKTFLTGDKVEEGQQEMKPYKDGEPLEQESFDLPPGEEYGQLRLKAYRD
jgi:type IV pilus assembly protein PilQ